jgi:Arc/MetJ-type ribon-helix-helix transcriptional regulator
MATITIRLDDETDARLKRRLVRSGESLSEFVRAAIVKQLAAGPKIETPYEAWARLVEDCAGSGDADRSVTWIKEKLRAKHRR